MNHNAFAEKPVIRIGFLGLGTVGQGVWKHLEASRDDLERRLGVRLEMARIAVRDPRKRRLIDLPPERVTVDAEAVTDDPSIDIVCELMGGTGRARELTLRALERGKAVVTANKALICEHGAEIFAAASRNAGHYFFEASVGGGIPIIKVLREGLVANRFPLIYGILNGTCNYILTRMEAEQAPFETILEDARRLGYVEPDEALDIDGWDTAHKAVILAFLAHGKWVPLARVPVEGIRRVALEDLRHAAELGYRVKLVAVVTRDYDSGKVFVRVHPALLPAGRIMANVNGVYNAASITGDVVGTTLLTGRGAGPDPTASAVISDIADAVLALRGGPPPVVSEEDEDYYRQLGEEVEIADPGEVESRYYLRLTVEDRPGVLAEVATLFARHGISIATVLQRELPDEAIASLVLTTHHSNEAAMNATLEELARHEVVRGAPLRLRIVDFE